MFYCVAFDETKLKYMYMIPLWQRMWVLQYSTVNRQNSNVEAENESPHQGRAEASDTTSWYNQEMCRELGSQGG